MARPISDEELQLKKRARRRLVGAVVLVTAVAVILPMVLDSDPKPVSQNVDIQIPSPESGEFKPKGIAPTPASKAPQAQETTVEAAVKSSQSDTKLASAETPKDTAKDTSKEAAPEDARGLRDAPVKAAATGAFVVQIEALADPTKAKRLQEKLSDAGVPAYTEAVATKGGELTRVRAGPFATKQAAEKARAQLKKAGFEGKVVAK